MQQLPLITGVLNYIKENNISFCMPGHKGGKGFTATSEGHEFLEKLVQFDLTEVDGLDNLHHPEGVLLKSQQLLSEYYGSKKSYYMINGSTGGNLAMVFAAFNEGDTVIIERNCHRSISNALVLRKLKPIYLKNEIDDTYDLPLPPSLDIIYSTIEENPGAKGLILTYPNYYGICINLKEVVKKAHEKAMVVLVDAAHGAHFGTIDDFPENPVLLGADYTVMSAHKTLPSLNQAAFLHLGDAASSQKADFYVSVFMSTSPSYMLLCSMEYARYYLEIYGVEGYKSLVKLTRQYKDKINSLNDFKVIDSEVLGNKVYKTDNSRFILNIQKGYSGEALYNVLRNAGIQPEMVAGRNIVLIFSPFNSEEEFENLYNVLVDCDMSKLKSQHIQLKALEVPEMIMTPYEAVEAKKIKLYIDESADKICGEAVVPYPPGIPLLNPGERIDGHTIDAIKYYLKNKITVLGILDDKITVIEDNYIDRSRYNGKR